MTGSRHIPKTRGARLVVVGKVDDVGFEEFATLYARRLSLAGRLTQLGGGRLEIELCGPRELIEMFETACWLGPRGALVDTVIISSEPPSSAYNDFSINSRDGVSRSVNSQRSRALGV
jgi:acylphosphatase